MADFGAGLGAVIGAGMAGDHLDEGVDNVNTTAGNFAANVGDYNSFGKSFLPGATTGIGDVKAKAGEALGYNQFMSDYTNTPAAEYQMQQADAVQNNSAASRGGLLSGANQRALSTINTGIVSQHANSAYDEYLKGNNQQFGQLETALGNMFSAIGVGQTATGQQAGVDIAKMGATTKLAGDQAKNDQAKGAGMGSMFSSVMSAPFGF